MRTNIEKTGELRSIVNLHRDADNIRRFHFRLFDFHHDIVSVREEKQRKQDEEERSELDRSIEKAKLMVALQDNLEKQTNLMQLKRFHDYLAALVHFVDVMLGGNRIFAEVHQDDLIEFIQNVKLSRKPPDGTMAAGGTHSETGQTSFRELKVNIQTPKDSQQRSDLSRSDHNSRTMEDDIENILVRHKDDLPTNKDGEVHFRVMRDGVPETVKVKVVQDDFTNEPVKKDNIDTKRDEL